MVLKIKLGEKKEKRLKKHLEKEHPSTKGHTSIDNSNSLGTKKQIQKIVSDVPNFKCQAMEVTKLKGGNL